MVQVFVVSFTFIAMYVGTPCQNMCMYAKTAGMLGRFWTFHPWTYKIIQKLSYLPEEQIDGHTNQSSLYFLKRGSFIVSQKVEKSVLRA